MSDADALARFRERGFPTTRLEDWKYTDLTPVAEICERWLATPDEDGDPDEALVRRVIDQVDAHWLVIANGRLVGSLSSANGVDGIVVSSLEDRPEIETGDGLADLNAACVEDSVAVRITPEYSGDKPLGLLVADNTSDAPRMSQVRVDLHVEAGAVLRLVEYHVSAGGDEHYSNGLLTLTLDETAKVDNVRIQTRGASDSQTRRLNVTMHRDSRFRQTAFDLGGRLTRNDLAIDIVGPGADARFNGLYLAGRGQHVDNHTRVDHRVGPAKSSQEYRGVLAGKCRAVWNGKAIVHPGADGTDATQANHNLLLSESSEIDAKPELEIYADDVKCAHGTTVGQLDESALFYLRSRGLDERTARQALIHAFATTVAGQSPIAELESHVAALVERRLADIDDMTEGQSA